MSQDIISRNIHKKSTLNVVGLLISGSALAQILQLLSQSFLARLYDVSQFGILAQVSSAGSIIAVAGTLQMHQAMVLPRSEEESCDLFATGFFASTLIAVIFFFAFSYWKVDLFGDTLSNLLPLLCSVFALGLCYGYLLRGWQTARGNFKVLSIFTVIHAICIILFQIGMGFLEVDKGLIYGVLIGEFVTSLFFIIFRYAPRISSVSASLIQPRKIFNYIKSYYQFSFIGTIQELVSLSVLMFPLFMFSMMYGTEIGGQYAMAHRFAWAPVLLVGNAFTQISFYTFSGLSIKELKVFPTLKFGKRTFAILCVGGAGALIFPIILPLILGKKWLLAGELGGWVSIWAVFFFLSIPYRVCYRVLQWQFAQLIVDGIILLCQFILFHNLSKISPVVMMCCLAIVGIFQNIIMIIVMRFLLSIHVRKSLTFTV